MPPPWMPWKWCMGGGYIKVLGTLSVLSATISLHISVKLKTTAPTAVQRWMVMGMYKSPIEIIYGQTQTQIEGDVFRAIQSYGINVDKEELIRALKYDRDQYEKGYADAMASIVRRTNMNNCGNCANYDRTKMEHTDVCSNCVTAYVGNERQEPSNWKAMPQTKADRIRAMSDEELAGVLMKFRSDGYGKAKFLTPVLPDTTKKIAEWLHQPAEASE